jgi:hypothetical protein
MISGTFVAGGVLWLRWMRTMPSMMVMPTPGQVAELHAFQNVLAGRMLRHVHDNEVGGAAELD